MYHLLMSSTNKKRLTKSKGDLLETHEATTLHFSEHSRCHCVMKYKVCTMCSLLEWFPDLYRAGREHDQMVMQDSTAGTTFLQTTHWRYMYSNYMYIREGHNSK